MRNCFDEIGRFENQGDAWIKYAVKNSLGGDEFFISIPEEFFAHFSESGCTRASNVFESIRQCASGKQFEISDIPGISQAQKLLTSWFRLPAIKHSNQSMEIVDRLYLNDRSDKESNIGILFSGGVDATFTLSWLRRKTERKIFALSIIHTADGEPDTSQTDLYRKFRQNLQKYNVDLFFISTNIMTADERINDLWPFITHGACLAAIGHLMSGVVDHWFISSSHDFSELLPWGSHPLLDPLFSSNEVLFSHFGTEFTRYDKVYNIVHGPIGPSNLSVCGKGPQAGAHFNCSRCQKCLRTMASLDLCGAREISTSFDWSQYSMEALSRVRLKGKNEFVFARELLSAATSLGRRDLEETIRLSIRKSWRHALFYRLEVYTRMKFVQSQHFKPLLKKIKRYAY